MEFELTVGILLWSIGAVGGFHNNVTPNNCESVEVELPYWLSLITFPSVIMISDI